MTVCALVLAAGRSERMGRPKAWIEWQGEAILARIVRVARHGGVDSLLVVAGADTAADPSLVSVADVQARLGSGVTAVAGAPTGTPIDSIRCGLPAVPADAHLLLWPVDCPFASINLVSRLIETLDGRPERIAVPRVGDRGGHPVLLGSAVWPELRTDAANGGAREILRRNTARVDAVMADDPRLVRSLNRPADLELL